MDRELAHSRIHAGDGSGQSILDFTGLLLATTNTLDAVCGALHAADHGQETA